MKFPVIKLIAERISARIAARAAHRIAVGREVDEAMDRCCRQAVLQLAGQYDQLHDGSQLRDDLDHCGEPVGQMMVRLEMAYPYATEARILDLAEELQHDYFLAREAQRRSRRWPFRPSGGCRGFLA
jgi:hypothetical protein